MRFAAPSAPTIWAPTSRPSRPIGHDLHRDRRRARVIARPAGRLDLGRNHVAVQIGCLVLRETDAGDFVDADLRDRSADHAGESDVAAGRVDPDDASLLVGMGAECDDHGEAGDAVHGLDAVPRRPHAADARLHASVGDDALLDADGDAGLAGERNVRSYAEAEDDDVGGQRSVGRVHGAHRSVLGFEPVHRLPEMERHAHGADRVGDQRSHVEIECRRHRLLGAVDQRDLEPAAHERLGHLEPDVAAPDDDRPPRLALVDGPPHGHAVGQCLHPEDAVGVDARDVRARRHRARRHYELVEGLVALAAVGGEVAHAHASLVDVDGDDLVAGAHVDAVLAVFIGRTRHEPLDVRQEVPDEVRDAARRVRRVGTALERDDLEVFEVSTAPGARRRGHAGSVAADDDEPLGHSSTRVTPAPVPASRRATRSRLRPRSRTAARALPPE